MANLTIEATPALNGYSRQFIDTSLTEVTNLAIYSIALAVQPDAALASIKNTLGAAWPATGQCSISGDGKFRLLGLAADQVFTIFTDNTVMPALDETAYITNQTDSWVTLHLEGALARTALERVCPIDLHPTVFPAGHVTRTSMEHLAAIIMCEAENDYLLLSPSSSAESFLHAIETSLHNVCG